MPDETNTFREWMDERRLKASDVCAALHVSEQTVHQWRSYGVPERRRPHVERYMAEWVDPSDSSASSDPATSILRIEFDDEEIDAVSKAAAIVDTPIREFIRRAAVHQARVDNARKANSQAHFPAATKMVPHLAAAAGPGIEAEVIETRDHTIRVKICGLSMDPLLADGQVIEMHSRIASRSPFMKKGLIYLVRLEDGTYTVKRFNTRRPKPEEVGEEWALNGRVGILESVNPAFKPITITGIIEWLAWLDPKELPAP